jgi:lipid II:glycine glycyltransferase (peptidoglycan interpeptide bridge formation enzyme)
MQVYYSSDWESELLDCKADIFHTENYTRLYKGDSAAEYQCLVAAEENKKIVLPILIKEIEEATNVFDFETPYGYSGPVSNTSDQTFYEKASKELLAFLKNENIIAGFIRYNPFLNNQHILRSIVTPTEERKIAYIDLSQGIEEIFENQIHPKHRNTIRSAKENCDFIIDYKWRQLDEFIDMYEASMWKKDASDFYLFPKSYFYELRDKFMGNAIFTLIRVKDEIAAAAIFLMSNELAHYHLAASREEFHAYKPNNLLIFETIKALKNKGLKILNLGGGNSSSDKDGLYQFKKRFTKNTHMFCTGKLIVDQDSYKDICKQWEVKHPELKEKYKNYHFKYRIS